MSIGVPKVPFRSPGEEDAVWVETGKDPSVYSFQHIGLVR